MTKLRLRAKSQTSVPYADTLSVFYGTNFKNGPSLALALAIKPVLRSTGMGMALPWFTPRSDAEGNGRFLLLNPGARFRRADAFLRRSSRRPPLRHAPAAEIWLRLPLEEAT